MKTNENTKRTENGSLAQLVAKAKTGDQAAFSELYDRTSTELYRSIMAEYPQLHLIASGGVASCSDIMALQQAGIPAVVFGKAIYEGRINLRQLIPMVNGTQK